MRPGIMGSPNPPLYLPTVGFLRIIRAQKELALGVVGV